MLRQAYVGGASDRVVHFFDAFVKETAALTQQPRQEPAPSAQRQPRIPLETLAAPGRGGSSATPPTPTKRIWTSQQVRAFYNEKVRGAYRGREAEAQRLENDLHAAIAEGRYRE
jgi:hypothetical protein